MKKQIGIWIDFRKAEIIELKKDGVSVNTVSSEIEEVRPVGGAGSRQPWGPMDNVSESKFLDRRKHQEKSFYELVMKEVNDADELFVFGPAEAKVGLEKMMKGSKVFKPMVRGVETADSDTLNQKVAKVKTFFRA